MIAHSGISVSNYDDAKKFYESLLAPLGYTLYMDLPEYHVVGFSDSAHSSFWIGEKEGTQSGHVAFLSPDKAGVEEFYKNALKIGGKDNGAPGYREQYSPNYYAAFIHDKDGNNIEAVWFDESKITTTAAK